MAWKIRKILIFKLVSFLSINKILFSEFESRICGFVIQIVCVFIYWHQVELCYALLSDCLLVFTKQTIHTITSKQTTHRGSWISSRVVDKLIEFVKSLTLVCLSICLLACSLFYKPNKQTNKQSKQPNNVNDEASFPAIQSEASNHLFPNRTSNQCNSQSSASHVADADSFGWWPSM